MCNSDKRIQVLSKFTEAELTAALTFKRNQAKNAKVDNYRKRIMWLNQIEVAAQDRFGVSLMALISTKREWADHIKA